MIIFLQTPSNIYRRVAGGGLCHPADPHQTPGRLVHNVLSCPEDGRPAQLMGPPPQLAQHLINSPKVHFVSCFARTSHGGVALPVAQTAGPDILPHWKSLSSSTISHPGNHLSLRSPYQGIHPSVCHTSKIISIHDHRPPCHNLHMLLSVVEGWSLHLKLHAHCNIMSTSSCVVPCELLP